MREFRGIQTEEYRRPPTAATHIVTLGYLTGTTGTTVDLSNYYTTGQTNVLLAGKSDTGHTHTFQSITAKPVTLSGYGITDAFTGHTAGDGIRISGSTLSVRTTDVPNVSGLEVNVSGLTLNVSGYTAPGGISLTANGPLRLADVESSLEWKVSVAGSRDTTFGTGTGFNNAINTILIQQDGRVLASGFFTSYNGVAANRIVRLNADGIRDSTFVMDTGFDGQANSIAIQPNGRIIAGGSFTTYNGVAANRIIRLNADGSRDNTFVVGTGFNNTVQFITPQPDGKVVVGGSFTTYNGEATNFIIRLNAEGSRDTAFVTGTGFSGGGGVFALALQPDGKVIVGGQFTTYNGVAANFIIRLNANGSLDSTFTSGIGFGNTVQCITPQPDGKLLVGGSFTTYNGVAANFIIRLNADGSRDNTFVTGTGFNNQVSDIALHPDGRIVAIGFFTTYDGVAVPGIIRLNADGSRDNTFVVGTGFNNTNSAIAFQPDGKLIVGGQFTTYQGTLANRIIRLNDTRRTIEAASVRGIEYAADYAGSYSPRSLTDKAYVDSRHATYTRCLFVTPSGSNATAQRGRMNLPFATINAANSAALAGDTVFVYPGTYVEQNVVRNNVNYHFFDGAVVAPGDLLRSISDENGPITSTIRGYGRFMGKGYNVNDTSTVMIGNASKLTIQASMIESIEVWHPAAEVTVENATVTFDLACYNFGTLRMRNCTMADCMTQSFNNTLTEFDNCVFRMVQGFPSGHSNVSNSSNFMAGQIKNIIVGGFGTTVFNDCRFTSPHSNVEIGDYGGVGTANHNLVFKGANLMWTDLALSGTTYTNQLGTAVTVNNKSLNMLSATSVFRFYGITYANTDATPNITNLVAGTGLVLDPGLAKNTAS